jgi:hypothetical protein
VPKVAEQMITAPKLEKAERQSIARPSVLSRNLLLCCMVVVALPFLALTFYAVPAADDLCKASLSFNGIKQRDIYHFVLSYYLGWSPRWITTAIQGSMMRGSDLLVMYPYWLLAAIAGNICALCYFLSQLFHLRARSAFPLAVLFYLVWITTVESPAESVYWLTGATEYGLCLTFMLVLAGMLISSDTRWKKVLAPVLAFVIPAQHELAGVVVCVFLMMGAIAGSVYTHNVRRWLIPLATALLSLVFVLAAPGIRVRQAQELHDPANVTHALAFTRYALEKGVAWTLTPSILLAGRYSCSYVRKRERRNERPAVPVHLVSWALIVGLVMVLGLLAASGTLSGLALPDRAVGWLRFVFLLLIFLLVLTVRDTVAMLDASTGLSLGLTGLLCMALLTSPNFRAATHDLRASAVAWRQSNAVRFSEHGSAAIWPRLSPKPRLLMDSELAPDPSAWTNRCTANYLNMQSVSVEPESTR